MGATKGFEGTRLPSSRDVRRWFAGQAFVRPGKGALVRSGRELASAPLCTLDADTGVIVTHTEDVVDEAGGKTLRSRLIHPVGGWVSSKVLVKACLLKGHLGPRSAGVGKALEVCFMEGGELITITDPLARTIADFFKDEPALRQYFDLGESASKAGPPVERARLPPPPPAPAGDARLLMVVVSCRKNEALWPGIRKRLASVPHVILRGRPASSSRPPPRPPREAAPQVRRPDDAGALRGPAEERPRPPPAAPRPAGGPKAPPDAPRP